MTRPGGGRLGAASTIAPAIPGRWAEWALCAQAELTQLAKRICGQCLIRAHCLDYALSGADTWGGIAAGIWGGTTPQERDQLRQQRKVVAA